MANCRIGMESRRTGWLAAAGDSLHIRMLKSSAGRMEEGFAGGGSLCSRSHLKPLRPREERFLVAKLNGHKLISRGKLLYCPCLIKSPPFTIKTAENNKNLLPGVIFSRYISRIAYCYFFSQVQHNDILPSLEPLYMTDNVNSVLALEAIVIQELFQHDIHNIFWGIGQA